MKKGGSAPEKPKAEEDVKKVGGPKPLPRGKKAKIQKMKDKYADQDDDERDMRLQLIGAKKVKGFELLEKKEQFKKREEPSKPEEVEEVEEELEEVPADED